MFASFRRYQKIIWTVAIIVIIPSFVIFFTDLRFLEGTGPAASYGSVDGREVPREEFAAGYRETLLLHRLNYGQWPGREEGMRRNLDQQALQRVALIRRLQEAKVDVPDRAVIDHIKRLFRDQTDQYSPELYQNWIQKILPEGGLTEDDLFRFFRHELGTQQLISVHGLSGRLTSPRGLEAGFRREHEQVEIAAVFLFASNFVAKVTVATNDVNAFYSNNLPRYYLPEKLQLSYVAYPVSNYFAAVDSRWAKDPDLEKKLEATYQDALQKGGTNAFLGEDGKALAPEAAKARLRGEVRKNEAMREGFRVANEFVDGLIAQEPLTLEVFARTVVASNLTMRLTQPFEAFEGPKELKLPQDFYRQLANLTTNAPVLAAPVVGAEAVFVVALNRVIPRQLQSRETVREKLLADYKQDAAQKLMLKAGSTLYTNLNAVVTKGKTFTDACSQFSLTAMELPAFSRSERNLKELDELVPFGRVREEAFELQPGKVSHFHPFGDRGYILFSKGRKPVSDETYQKEFPKHLEEVRDRAERQAFNDWFTKRAQITPPTESRGEKKTGPDQ
jgi:hypothetical protein